VHHNGTYFAFPTIKISPRSRLAGAATAELHRFRLQATQSGATDQERADFCFDFRASNQSRGEAS
jgi:hypothetical protein